MKLEGNKLIAFLKVGYKRLFFWDELYKIRELNPLCVLDFYVNDEYQRNGFGKVVTNFIRISIKYKIFVDFELNLINKNST